MNPRHTKFAELYVLYGNATRAYAEAYDVVKTDGKFPHWASVEGHRLLRYPSVKAEMAKGSMPRLVTTPTQASTVSFGSVTNPPPGVNRL